MARTFFHCDRCLFFCQLLVCDFMISAASSDKYLDLFWGLILLEENV